MKKIILTILFSLFCTALFADATDATGCKYEVRYWQQKYEQTKRKLDEAIGILEQYATADPVVKDIAPHKINFSIVDNLYSISLPNPISNNQIFDSMFFGVGWTSPGVSDWEKWTWENNTFYVEFGYNIFGMYPYMQFDSHNNFKLGLEINLIHIIGLITKEN